MAHGGHSGGHSHVHRHSSRGGGSDLPFPFYLGLLVVCIIIIFITAQIKSDIGGKKPLEGTYTKYSSYLIDEEDYFSNQTNLISGLQYLHEHTNVQVVVMSSNESWSDSKAVDEYYKKFDDEAHVLIIVPTAWYTSTTYYAIGDLADSVIDDKAMDYLLESIDNSRNGEKWETKLKNFTDKLLLEE